MQSLSVVGHMQSIAAGICTLQLAALVATVPEDACGKIGGSLSAVFVGTASCALQGVLLLVQ